MTPNPPAPTGPAPVPEPADVPADGWREMVRDAGEEFRERLAALRSLALDEREQGRLARRFREAVDAALEVPEDLPARVAAEVAALREAHPGADPVELAWARTRSRARRAAAAGAVTAVPAMVPGVGTALAALGVVADWRYVAEQQRDLVLEVAAVFGVTVERPTERVRGLFLASTGTAFGAVRAGEAATRVAARQVARRGVARLVPGVGAAVSAALNYLSTLAVGRAAIDRFAKEAGVEVRGLAPEAAHPALPRLRQATVAAVQTAPLGDGSAPVFTAEQRAILERLPPRDREELLDLAVVSAGAEEDETLAQVACELGFDEAALEEARVDARGGMEIARRRFRRTLRRARQGGARAARRAWKRARRIARRGDDGPDDSEG